MTKTLSELIRDIQPLVRRFSDAQRAWLHEITAESATGPYNQESLIALIAMASSFTKQMLQTGYSPEDILYWSEVADQVSEYIVTKDIARDEPEAKA